MWADALPIVWCSSRPPADRGSVTGQAREESMSGVGFVHLHVHSAFSLLEGALTIRKLADLAKADRQPALALTDTSNLFGALEFSEKFAESGLQPIAGATIAADFADREAAPGTKIGAL